MKKFFGALICLFVLNGCDDGELTFDTFDFSEVQASNCQNNNLIYKVNGNEALVIQINSTSANDVFPFRNVLGTKIIPVNSQNKIFYRTFSSDVSGSSYFCSTIPPVSPTVTSEYSTQDVSNGTIEITTTLTPGATTLANAGYNHTIIFRNITFANPGGGTIVYDELVFGSYRTPSQVEFGFTSLPVRICTGVDGKYFKLIDSNVANSNVSENLNKVLEINIPTSLLPTANTEVRRVFINQTPEVTAVYRIYSGDISTADYCAEAPSLVKYEEWNANTGIDADQDVDDAGYFLISASNDPDNPGELLYSVTLKRFSFTRSFPSDGSGNAATFTNTADINFGQISLP